MTVYLNAISPSGTGQSTVDVEADVWVAIEPELRAALAAKGYALDVLGFVPPPGSQYAPERHLTDIAAALEWAQTLDEEED